MKIDNNNYSFIANTSSFYEIYGSEKEAIEAAQKAYDEHDEDILGYDYDKDEIPHIVSILKVYDFEVNIEKLVDNIRDCIEENINEEYYEFESTVDDADIYIKKGFKDELKKLVSDYISPGGTSSIGYAMYDYDLKNHCIIKKED